MKPYLILFGAILSLGSLKGLTQDCSIYYPVEKGSVREMTSYDQKNNVTGMVRQEVTSVSKSGGNLTISVHSIVFDAENQQLGESDMELGCSDGVFKIDMSDYVSDLTRAYQSMEVELTGDELAFPSSMKPGDVLPDGQINIKVINNGMMLMNMDVTITNRKVEGIEEISTPAGKFKCLKITYDSTAKTKILNIQTRGVEWISENVGAVKTESFNKKGKSTGYTLLTGLK